MARTEAEPSPLAPAPVEAQLEGEETCIPRQVNRAKQLAEIDAILAVLKTTHWNRKQAAAILGIDYKALLYRMKKLNIDDSAVQVVPPRKEPARAEQPAKIQERATRRRILRIGDRSGYGFVLCRASAVVR